MKTKNFILLLTVTLCLGCNKDDEWDNKADIRDSRSANFVTAYINDKSEIKLDFSTTPTHSPFYIGSDWINDGRQFGTKNLYIILHYDRTGKSSLTYGTAYLTLNQSHAGNPESHAPSFSDLAIQNNDVTYNGYRWDCIPYFNSPVTAVDITCSKDYDANHPAGTPLNDIAMINFYSAKPFIDSKYQDPRLGDYIQCRTIEPVTEFNKKGADILRADLSFNLLNPPENADSYQFTITCRTQAGAALSVTAIPITLLSLK